VGIFGGACHAFTSTSPAGPPPDGGTADGTVTPATSCVRGQAVTLAAGVGVHVLASDATGVYWSSDLLDGGAEIVAQTRDQPSVAEGLAGVSFLLPRTARIVFGRQFSDGCYVQELTRAPFAPLGRESGYACGPVVATGDENTLFLATTGSSGGWSISQIEPSPYGFPDRPSAPVGTMVTDGAHVFATILGASPDILEFSESSSATSVVPDAGPAGPLVLSNGRLTWLTNAGELRSVSTAGGESKTHGTFAGATKLANDGACVYVATPTAIVAVSTTDDSPTPVAEVSATELTASSVGVFWTTGVGDVEGIWR
jgi:hypothetical protein